MESNRLSRRLVRFHCELAIETRSFLLRCSFFRLLHLPQDLGVYGMALLRS